MAKRKLPAAMKKKYEFSETLAEITGKSKGSRQEATKWWWEYVKEYDLQDPNDGRLILVGDDELLSEFAPRKKKIKMTEVGKYLSEHLYELD